MGHPLPQGFTGGRLSGSPPRSAMQEPSLAVAAHPWHDGAARALRSDGISAGNTILPAEGFEYAWQGKSHYLALHDIRLRDGEMRSDDGPPTHERETRGKLS